MSQPGAGERQRRRPADAAAGAGDEGDGPHARSSVVQMWSAARSAKRGHREGGVHGGRGSAALEASTTNRLSWSCARQRGPTNGPGGGVPQVRAVACIEWHGVRRSNGLASHALGELAARAFNGLAPAARNEAPGMGLPLRAPSKSEHDGAAVQRTRLSAVGRFLAIRYQSDRNGRRCVPAQRWTGTKRGSCGAKDRPEILPSKLHVPSARRRARRRVEVVCSRASVWSNRVVRGRGSDGEARPRRCGS